MLFLTSIFFVFCECLTFEKLNRTFIGPRKKGESELYDYLFGKYNQLIRPVKHANQSVVIKFELFIAQLVKVDEESLISIKPTCIIFNGPGI